jgi:hypothetical protein
MASSNVFRVGGIGWRRACAAVLSAIAMLGTSVATPAPFTPREDDEILERLASRTGPEWDGIRALREALAAEPTSAPIAAELARRYLELYRAEGDPRLVGYARVALAPWSQTQDPPLEIALQRALVAQTEHRFAEAAADLERLIVRAPRDPRPWLISAAIDLVHGDYAASRRACGRLLLLADASVAGVCLAAVQAVTGDVARAYDYLAATLKNHARELDTSIAAWLTTLAAETAAALGREREADAHFHAALDLEQRLYRRPSIYLLATYSDFLLELDRPDAVLALLDTAPAADPILLRLALAKRRLDTPIADELEMLRYRLQLPLAGEDDAHAREAAYLALYLLDDSRAALDLAIRNFGAQREPIDARLVLEAAIAADEPAAAALVLEWMKANAVEHATLRRLATTVGEL